MNSFFEIQLELEPQASLPSSSFGSSGHGVVVSSFPSFFPSGKINKNKLYTKTLFSNCRNDEIKTLNASSLKLLNKSEIIN